jgi:glyoxylase-like metal-dependent hydrolase (beta-lactamase superfamily II)
MTYQHTKITDIIDKIALSPPMAGFENFICCWVYQGKDTFIVDPGPAVTADDLRQALTDLGITALDYILLTHIHIDHAGGIAKISDAFPDAPVICHKMAIPHLTDPEKLWQGTLKTLGDTGRAYGKILPVPQERLVDAEKFSAKSVRVIITPGHAPHHASFITDAGELFAGETAGVNIPFTSAGTYLRPATPPRLHLETAIKSLDKLIAGNPDMFCYGHTNWSAEGTTLLKTHREQLLFWESIISQEMAAGDDDTLVDRCLKRLRHEDELLAGLIMANEAVAEREQYFLSNSIKGFIGYLRDKQADS